MYAYAIQDGIYIKIHWTNLNDQLFSEFRFTPNGEIYLWRVNKNYVPRTVESYYYPVSFQHFDLSRSLDSVTNLAVRFRTLSSSSWLHLGVQSLTAWLQDNAPILSKLLL